MIIERWTSRSTREQPFEKLRTVLPRLSTLQVAVLLCTLLLTWAASAQVPPPPTAAPAPSAPAQPPAPPPPAYEPGFLDALQRWLGDSKAKLDQSLKGTQEAIGELGTRATEAA